MDGEREGVCIWKSGVCVHEEREGVCTWKGSSVHAWEWGGCVHMEGVECAGMGRGRIVHMEGVEYVCMGRGWVYMEGLSVHGEREGVCIWKGSSVCTWGWGGGVHIEG